MTIFRVILALILLQTFYVHANTFSDILKIHDKKALYSIIENNSNNKIESLEKQATAYHQLAVLKVDKASNKALNLFKELYKNEELKNNPFIIALLGSSHTLYARDASFFMTKLSNANKGIAFLNKAVEISNNNPDILLIRAEVFYNLPERFEKEQISINDYSFVLEKSTSLTDEQQAYYLYKALELSKRIKDKSQFNKFKELLSNPKYINTEEYKKSKGLSL